jgi:hypothetical protein
MDDHRYNWLLQLAADHITLSARAPEVERVDRGFTLMHYPPMTRAK